MKKLLVLLMTLALLAALASCNPPASESAGTSESTSTSESASESTSTSESTSASESMSESTGNDLSRMDVTYATPFSEGKAFVRDGDAQNRLHCIDTEGNVLFTVEHPNSGGYLYVSEGFYNGYAALDFNTAAGGSVLCDASGDLIQPSDLGADAFLIREEEIGARALFRKGYFYAKKTETGFMGSVEKIALFDVKGNKIIDYTEELRTYTENDVFLYQNVAVDRWSGTCLDLTTGEERPISEALEDIVPLRPSDLWSDCRWGEEGLGYYDLITGECRISLDAYAETIEEGGSFENGLAPLMFDVIDSVYGARHYFTILKDTGEFAFEPIEVDPLYQVLQFDGETFVLHSYLGEDDHKLASVGTDGVLREISLTTSGNFFEVQVKATNEGVMVKERGAVRYYGMDLEQLL